MRLLIVFGLVASTLAGSQKYGLPSPSTSFIHSGGVTGGSGSFGNVGGGGGCGDGQIRHVDGNCVLPIVNRNIFVYAAPKFQYDQGPAPVIPQPKVDYNIVFVRTPERPEGLGPIVMPPPQQKTLVYVLSQNQEIAGQQVIEMSSVPQSPEVYYIQYDEGDNPTLPGGIDLQSALASAAQQQGQVIEGGGAGFAGASSGFGGGSSSFGGGSFGGGSHGIVGGGSFGGGSHGSVGGGSFGGGSHISVGGGSTGGGSLSQTYGTP